MITANPSASAVFRLQYNDIFKWTKTFDFSLSRYGLVVKKDEATIYSVMQCKRLNLTNWSKILDRSQ